MERARELDPPIFKLPLYFMIIPMSSMLMIRSLFNAGPSYEEFSGVVTSEDLVSSLGGLSNQSQSSVNLELFLAESEKLCAISLAQEIFSSMLI